MDDCENCDILTKTSNSESEIEKELEQYLNYDEVKYLQFDDFNGNLLIFCV
jgi:hypothetical protein